MPSFQPGTRSQEISKGTVTSFSVGPRFWKRLIVSMALLIPTPVPKLETKLVSSAANRPGLFQIVRSFHPPTAEELAGMMTYATLNASPVSQSMLEKFHLSASTSQVKLTVPTPPRIGSHMAGETRRERRLPTIVSKKPILTRRSLREQRKPRFPIPDSTIGSHAPSGKEEALDENRRFAERGTVSMWRPSTWICKQAGEWHDLNMPENYAFRSHTVNEKRDMKKEI